MIQFPSSILTGSWQGQKRSSITVPSDSHVLGIVEPVGTRVQLAQETAEGPLKGPQPILVRRNTP